jgi:glycosyltransferase involved in cell wall biosynthesis
LLLSMNILMLAWLFWPHVGGVERHVERIGKILVDWGHRVKVITVRHEHGIPLEEERGGIEIHRYPKQQLDQWERKRVARWLVANRHLVRWADVVHCHDFYTFNYWYFPLFLRYPRKPVYLTFHGFEESYPLWPKDVMTRRVDSYLTRGNICIGDFIPMWYRTRYNYISYGGVDVPSPVPPPPEEDRALFVGRLAPDTGILLYIDALLCLRREYGLRLRLDICGDGPLRSRIADTAKRHDLDIVLHGFVSDPERYLAGTKFAFTSSYLAILEAMAWRRAVFGVYQNPLKRDYLLLMPGARRMMVVASTGAELAHRVAAACRGELDLGAMVDCAHDFAGDHSWSTLAQTYLDLYAGREGWHKPPRRRAGDGDR